MLYLVDTVVFDKNTCLLWIPHSLHFINFTINVRSLMGSFAGITTQIITITYFENIIYHRLLALN